MTACMAHKMKFMYRVGFTIVVFSCLALFFLLGRWGERVAVAEVAAYYKVPARIVREDVGPSSATTTAHYQVPPIREFNNTSRTIFGKRSNSPIILAVVICGDRVNETIVMLKSAAALTMTPLSFVIVAEDALHEFLQDQLKKWPTPIQKRISYKIYPISFPFENNAEEWKKLFKPCAAQRLFLPNLLTDIDSLLYVDTDVLFLRPLDHIWNYFTQMNETQMAAMTPEHEDFATGWYNRFARHPYFKPLGVNSGVMLMNLTRMRQFKWQSVVVPVYEKYKYKITWGDQDIINIIFHMYPEKLYVYPCEWNFRSDHCMYMSVCKSAEENGVGVLHGNRAVFHTEKQPAFKVIYETFQQYNLGEDLTTHLFVPMENALKNTLHTNCGKLYRIFLKSIKKYLPGKS